MSFAPTLPSTAALSRTLLASSLLLGSITLGVAQDASAQVDVGVIASTEGAGLEVATLLSPTWRLRLGAAGATYGDDLRAGDILYDADAEFRSAMALLDWSPGGGVFHVSFGAIYNDHVIEGRANVLDNVLASGEFTQQEIDAVLALLPPGFDPGFLRAEATFDSVSPYLGFGWRSAKASGVGLSFDVGAIYLGQADATVTVQTDLPVDLVPTGDQLLADFLAEQEREIEEEAEDYQIYPVLRFSVFYRF